MFRHLLALALLALACGGEDAPRWPTRNYSGTYAVRTEVASNDCASTVAVPEDTLLLTLHHAHDNTASVELSPVVLLRGSFQGDRLEARAIVPMPAGLLAERSDSTPVPDGAIRYSVELEFDGGEIAGRYSVHQPGLGRSFPACDQSFRLTGEQLREEAPGGPV